MIVSEDTEPKQRPAHWFRPGESGNPKGRPKGSRNRLGEAFIQALADDFEAHGASAIEECRIKHPARYLSVVASLLPKEEHLEIDVTQRLAIQQFVADYRTVQEAMKRIGVDEPKLLEATTDDDA
jgi:hypothetical protein